MFTHKAKVFRLSRMEAAKSNIFQTVEIIVAWGGRYLLYRKSERLDMLKYLFVMNLCFIFLKYIYT